MIQSVEYKQVSTQIKVILPSQDVYHFRNKSRSGIQDVV